MKITEIDEPGLFLLGIELLDSAGQTIFETLERQLKPLFGDDWFSISLVRNIEDRELAPRDLSALLVQLEIRNNSNFRLALRTEYNNGQQHDKEYFELLRDLRITRNEWFHRIISPITTDELLDLSQTIIGVFPASTQVASQSRLIVDMILAPNFSGSDLLKTSAHFGKYVTQLEKIQAAQEKEREIDEIMIEAHIENEKSIMEQILLEDLEFAENKEAYTPIIGEPFTGSLLPQKYSLKLDGTIIDRREGIELRDKLGEKAILIGKGLLKNHPTGGRLRLASDGTVVGYEDEEWVVIGKVELNDWFEA